MSNRAPLAARRSRAEDALAEQAEKMDRLLAELETSFQAMEAATVELRQAGGTAPDVNVRRFTIINACWHHARTLSSRLGIARSAGGPGRWRPLAETYPRRDPLDA